ncbi:membrane protein involved in er to golgi [Plasmopara halstedii]|uniref:Vesicle transport protein n=1 Tax=Plasmopara halstedii TaxID=4781 RepID=A0A0P1B1D5_PLAHL|nr:membrane protein involved in er to golgi [Plasmopara halstedii]CEG47986.1 membrane protein involved in er to golgi [Plasmopara halstedii]|eukprot:XP_024584355.1 membrane protein involved in er to golgi [Plasmopara halstedii]
MDHLKEQSKKASDKLDDIAKKTRKELKRTSDKLDDIAEKTRKELKKTSKKAQESIDKVTKQGKEASATATNAFKTSAKDAFYIDVNIDKNKNKSSRSRRKDSSDTDSDEEDGLLDDIGDELDQLTLNQRALGAVGCYVLSGFFVFVATLMLLTGVHHVRSYALFYSLSNIATFCSLIFIMGQDRLTKRMLSRKRSLSGRAWLASLALTLIVAMFWPRHWFSVLVLLLLQFVSMVWYSVSYIPFGRKFLHKYMARKVIIVDAMDGKIDGK